jgi:RND superfamily putative drug exporter
VTPVGPIGRLGAWTARNARKVFVAWALIALALGVLAPRAEHALSGAGWEASGSESVRVRDVLDRDFGGLSSSALMVVLHSDEHRFRDQAFTAAAGRVQRLLQADDAVRSVVPPRPGVSVSRDRHTAVVQAGAASDSNDMVRAADELEDDLRAAGGRAIEVSLTGASGMWSDFNTANKQAMLKSELISWPVTLAIMVLAFGSLVAAGLPLMLTIVGLVAAAGSLYLGTQLFDISIWAMNFALMFALALGIDYALFVVYRFRAALFGSHLDRVEATAVAMDTAGKAVLFSGLTVLISLSAVMLVPSPAFRSMSLGIMLSVAFVLAATLTLLPAVLATLGARIDRLSLPWAHSGEHRSGRFERWARLLWRRPLALGATAVAVLVALSLPVFGLDTGMPSIKVVPPDDSSRVGYERVQAGFGDGAPGALQVVTSPALAGAVRRHVSEDPGVARTMPVIRGAGGRVVLGAVPRQDPSDEAVAATIERLRAQLPAGTLVGGAVAENHDLEQALAAKTAPVIGLVLALGFLLLLYALRAPVIAAVGVATNLLAVGAAFGVAKLIFQNGNLQGLLGFESQGFMNAWAPVFFFAMVFAISMDYTVFLLSSAKEHWDRGEGAKGAMLGGVAHSGRVIFAAAAVMVAVFFTFALFGPLPPKEMGVVLGVAVLLDALLVRLLLVPVLLRFLGDAAWWLPEPLDRILPKVRFGHA